MAIGVLVRFMCNFLKCQLVLLVKVKGWELVFIPRNLLIVVARVGSSQVVMRQCDGGYK